MFKSGISRAVLAAAVVAWCVVALGAYVRLSDAGLGCPDWPGCYGRIAAPIGVAEAQAITREFPGASVEAPKAWKEMAHRYIAGTLGLSILAIFLWTRRSRRAAGLPAALVGLVGFQALLGMWTVTERLKPVIVTAHLLGGMTTLALLTWLALRYSGQWVPVADHGRRLRIWAALGLAVVAAQIALGGWTSSNYAGLACGPTLSCRGEWWPSMDFAGALELDRGLGMTADGGYLSLAALTAIHWLHRLGALVTATYLLWLSAKAYRVSGLRHFAWPVAALAVLQVGLGLGNIQLGLPLALAVGHNAVAALLLVALVILNFRLRPMEGAA
jgi:cytochrome c oxidase assembly protein subunit 15